MFAATAPEALPAAEVVAYVLGALALILIAARIVGGLFVRFSQPRIVGEMIAGILIGPTMLGGRLASGAVTATGKPAVDGEGLVNTLYPLQSFAFLSLIGTLTLVFYMFLVGLEVEQRLLRGREAQIILVSLAVIAVPVGLGFLVGGLLDEPGTWAVAGSASGTHALFVGAGLSVTAFPVMAAILQEKRMISSPMGAVGVGAAAVVTPLMFLLVAGASASAKGDNVLVTIGTKLALALVFAVVLFAVVRPALQFVIDRRFQLGEPLNTDLFAILLFGALVAGLIADRIGIHSLNGGFLFGACVPQVAALARAVFDRMRDLVITWMIPIFLAVSGLQTDLRQLEAGMIPGVLLFIVAMVVGKWGAGAIAGRAVGLSWSDASAIGVLMNCRGLMILVVALIGLQVGVITPAMQIAFVLGAIITTLMTGPLVDVFLPATTEDEPPPAPADAVIPAID